MAGNRIERPKDDQRDPLVDGEYNSQLSMNSQSSGHLKAA